MQDEVPVFEYALQPLRGRRRWRWELWDGATLLAAGWHVTSRHAEQAVRLAAARSAHERLGLRVLRPALKHAVASAGRGTRIQLGPVGCELVARAA